MIIVLYPNLNKCLLVNYLSSLVNHNLKIFSWIVNNIVNNKMMVITDYNHACAVDDGVTPLRYINYKDKMAFNLYT